MRIPAASLCASLLIGCASPRPIEPAAEGLEPLLAALERHGRDPVAFVLERLQEVDLLLFDDGLHSAVEPFEFYVRLVEEPAFRRAVDVLFLEVVALNQQPHIDAFLGSESGDPALLLPAFRNDVSGTGGIGYRTYLELLEAVRRANRSSPPQERLRVVAVSNPTYWSEIDEPGDVALFQRGLLGRDYDMYRIMLEELDGFRSGRKGVFLTNTRHAYTGIRDARGAFHGNTGTFFRQQHPGKTCSIRLHNVTLALEREEPEPCGPATAEGLERVRYHWARVDGGRWDAAFAARGNRPVALPLPGTAFGRAPYLGNHMLDALPGQTMADAYDALIFLAPLERLRQSATMPGLYGADFLPELARRYRLQRTDEELAAELTEAGVTSLEALAARSFVESPERPVPAPTEGE
jgi:hypothetical protein